MTQIQGSGGPIQVYLQNKNCSSRKNIKFFAGNPMIYWSITAAIKSNLFDRVIVSTDDEEIALIAKSCGAEVPFIRPPEIADDYAGTTAVVAHALRWLIKHGTYPSIACCIYATAPFIEIEDLARGVELLLGDDVEYVFSVTSYSFPIQRAVLINDSGRVKMFNPENFNCRSQDFIRAYHDAGQFYWAKTAVWLDEKIIFSEKSIPIILPRCRVQDIDDLEDWQQAERMFIANKSS